MHHPFPYYKFSLVSLFVAALIAFQGCSGREAIDEKSFVGKWRSSKLTTPIYLYDNGDWEIKNDEGVILQYGIWEYKDKIIIWSYKIDSYIGHDVNAVLAVSTREFKLLEKDKSTTTFVKLD